ncbi:hypothetical protein HPP92_010590 [Vanilla planifolia]|uniref:Uncharacterized protein n=1 Tax=Vanilla planifolia TaxID=51239 RepID=A0A835R419_VANPL|nr:hypothetical protein HPP92_010590 [Vanilla planifolia]
MKGEKKPYFKFFGYKHHGKETEQKKSSEKMWVSDQDKGQWVAEHDIDQKAAKFINKEHQRMSTKACTILNHPRDKKPQTGKENDKKALHGEVMACSYEDVQVMWSILDKAWSSKTGHGKS